MPLTAGTRLGSYEVLAPLGAGGTVAIYTNHFKPVHPVAKVTIRMNKWLLYVLPSVDKP